MEFERIACNVQQQLSSSFKPRPKPTLAVSTLPGRSWQGWRAEVQTCLRRPSCADHKKLERAIIGFPLKQRLAVKCLVTWSGRKIHPDANSFLCFEVHQGLQNTLTNWSSHRCYHQPPPRSYSKQAREVPRSSDEEVRLQSGEGSRDSGCWLGEVQGKAVTWPATCGLVKR